MVPPPLLTPVCYCLHALPNAFCRQPVPKGPKLPPLGSPRRNFLSINNSGDVCLHNGNHTTRQNNAQAIISSIVPILDNIINYPRPYKLPS